MNHPAPCPVANTGQLGKRGLGLPEAGLNFPPPSSREVRSTCALRKPRSRERNGRGVKRGSVVRFRKESPARKRYHVPASMAAGRGVRRSAALGRWLHPCGEKKPEKIETSVDQSIMGRREERGEIKQRNKEPRCKTRPQLWKHVPTEQKKMPQLRFDSCQKKAWRWRSKLHA